MAYGNLAAAYEAAGDTEKAIENYQVSAQMFKELGEHDLRVFVLKNLSALQLRSGEQFQSMATMQAALDIEKKPTLIDRILKKLLKVPFKMLK